MAVKTRGRGRPAAAKPAPEPERRTYRKLSEVMEDVPEIVERLQASELFTEVGLEYAALPTVRKALALKGYDTAGNKMKVEKLDMSQYPNTAAGDKALAKTVAEMRENFEPWFKIALATDLSEVELKELLEDNGFKELASGRQIKPKPEKVSRPRGRPRKEPATEDEPEPRRGRRGRQSAAEEPEAPVKRGRGRPRKTETPEPAPAAKRGRRARPAADEETPRARGRRAAAPETPARGRGRGRRSRPTQ